eukprot:gene12627-14824_t
MNLSDSDNDMLIASCFDFIDIDDSDNDDDEHDDDYNNNYSYHSMNNIQQYFKSNGNGGQDNGQNGQGDSDLEASDEDIFGSTNDSSSFAIKTNPNANLQRRRRAPAGQQSSSSSSTTSSNSGGNNNNITNHINGDIYNNNNGITDLHVQVPAQPRRSADTHHTSSTTTTNSSSASPMRREKADKHNQKFKSGGGGKNVTTASSNEFGGASGVVKILKRNETNMDPEQLNKLFSTPTKNGDDNGSTTNGGVGVPKTTRATKGRERREKRPSAGQQRESNGHNNNNNNNKTKGGPNTNNNKNVANGQNGVTVAAATAPALLAKRKNKEEKAIGRILGEAPIHFDLDSVSFTSSNGFQQNEIVLVPRSRGGFTYGKIYEVMNSSLCHHDPSVHHPGIQYRAIYPSGAKKDNLFKDLPGSYLGKLVPFDKLPPDFKSFALEPVTTQRSIGQKASLKDLQNLVFSPAAKFHPNQVGLIPRSKGGFTYGCIVKDCRVPCKVDDIKHEVQGYRVVVEKKKEATIIKDLIVGNIGKIYTIENQQPTVSTTSNKQPIQQQEPIKQQQQKKDQDIIVPAQQQQQGSAVRVSNGEDEDEEMILWSGETCPPTSLVGSPTAVLPSSPQLQPQDVVQQPPLYVAPVVVAAPPQSKLGLFPPTAGARGVIEMPSDSIVFNPSSSSKKKKPLYLVVIDGPNVAKKYAKKTIFSVLAIKKALDYYIQRGYEAVAFVPESVATRKPTGPNQPLKIMDFQSTADNLPLLLELVDKGQISLTPPQDEFE